MKKYLFIVMALVLPLIFVSCSKDDDNDNNKSENTDFNFTSESVNTPFDESVLIDFVGVEPSKCNFTSSDDFIFDVAVNNNKIKVIPHHVGEAELTARYKDVTKSCQIKVTPTVQYAEIPLLNLGTSRDDVIDKMSNYQHAGTVGGYKGEDYFFNLNSKVRYQFDKDNKLVAVKQELTKRNYPMEKIKKGLQQRYKFVSGSNLVLWYSHPNKMMVRVEETVTKVNIWFAKDASTMNDYFPF